MYTSKYKKISRFMNVFSRFVNVPLRFVNVPLRFVKGGALT